VIEGLDVPRSSTIPWFAVNVLWAVKVRRAHSIPKYRQILVELMQIQVDSDLISLMMIARVQNHGGSGVERKTKTSAMAG
jgi:hypothetical protein